MSKHSRSFLPADADRLRRVNEEWDAGMRGRDAAQRPLEIALVLLYLVVAWLFR